ncbi:putative hotdog family 3-hydroxylacyl-ACP dehydratase [Herbaspirillum rubrisubalbicans]|uniref:hotdog family protein n=1 Tax=Herbaspirillum rubrisubalbicans TaxID=80842 RepID=UPI0020A06578|nr:hotdog family protein [Herbaspirillum rubrisubalbicans]MCP1574216.1 putative hotdog family 3-hydroxylacyl-ACP dehydratase [Herbaspirillum rubrisubalbicans]
MSSLQQDIPPIEQLLPHAAPMILIDRVVAVDEQTLQAELEIRTDSLFHQGSGVGAWVGIEYMAQGIAAWAGYQALRQGGSVKIGFLLGARRYQCAIPEFATGTRLGVSVRLLLQADSGLGSFECRITDLATQQELAQATVSVFQPHDATHYLQESMA